MLTAQVSRFFDVVQQEIGGIRLGEVLALRDTRLEKPDGSYVTQGDLLVQSIVSDLAKEHLSNHFLVSEELEGAALDPAPDAVVLVVDPIDGTENFTSGLPEWGVSIACFRNGQHIGSMLGAPELGQWLRTGDQVRRFDSRIRGLSSSLSREQIMQVGLGPEYRILGCCAVNMMAVIRGSYQSFENPKGAHSWDILAGLNLAKEHGLLVEVDGRTYAGEYLAPDAKYRFRIEQSVDGRHE